MALGRRHLFTVGSLALAAALLMACGDTPPVACETLGCGTGAGGAGGAGGGADQLGGFDPGKGSGGYEACATVHAALAEQTPTITLLVDQSGSMTESFGDGLNRWQAIVRALGDADAGVVAPLESRVRFGISLYTSHNGFQGGACPLLSEVAPALDNYAAIDALLDASEPEADTPTGESVAVVAPALAALPYEGPKAIVLATDGEPDTCAVPNPQQGQAQVIEAVQAAYAQGISTYVVSVGDEVGLEHLQDVANAGVGLPIDGAVDAPYYQALDPKALVEHFDTIIDGVRSCLFEVEGEIAPELVADGEVRLDGALLAYQDDDGWKLAADGRIELVGAACEALLDGEHELDARFPCPIEPPK